MLPTVIAQREFVDSLLEECSVEFRPRLLSICGSISSSIGFYFFDLDGVASVERGLQLFDGSFVGSLAFCALRLGTGRLLSGEVEEAARVIGEGAVLATKNRSARRR